MLAPEIAAQLRRRGWDVEAIQADYPEMIALDDPAVLEQSTRMGRVLVTDNVRHFMPIHEQYVHEQRTHAGLIIASYRSYPRGSQTIGLWVRGLELVLERLRSVSSDNLCEWLTDQPYEK